MLDGLACISIDPVAMLCDKYPKTRMSDPDLIWDGGHLYITETQKSIARVHKIPSELLNKLWNQAKCAW